MNSCAVVVIWLDGELWVVECVDDQMQTRTIHRDRTREGALAWVKANVAPGATTEVWDE